MEDLIAKNGSGDIYIYTVEDVKQEGVETVVDVTIDNTGLTNVNTNKAGFDAPSHTILGLMG